MNGAAANLSAVSDSMEARQERMRREMAEKLKGYVAAGLVKAPVFVNVVFDQSECGRSFREYAEKLLTIIGYFPEDWHWSVTRGGDSAPAIAAMAIALGGHVRTGLEDSLYYSPGVFAKDSAQLIARVHQEGTTIVQVTHDQEELAASKQLLHMEKGGVLK